MSVISDFNIPTQMSVHQGDGHDSEQEHIIDGTGLDKQSSPNYETVGEPMKGSEQSDRLAAVSNEVPNSSDNEDYDQAFFIETHRDVNDEQERNVFMDNQELESVSDKYDVNAVESSDELSQGDASEIEGYQVLSLFEIMSHFLHKHYAGDIEKVKAIYAQLITIYKAGSGQSAAGGKSEIF